MYKYVYILLIMLFIHTISFSQIKEEMVSFTYETYLEDDRFSLWYIIKPCFKYSDGLTRCEADSFLRNDPILSKVFPINHSFRSDWFYWERCYFQNEFYKCYNDSILLYTPIAYFFNKEEPHFDDTLSVINYSHTLYKMNEYRIYNANINHDVLRFSDLNNKESKVFRIEYSDDTISLTCKKSIKTDNSYELIFNETIQIDYRKYERVLNLLNRSNYWKMEKEFSSVPRNILVESEINHQFHFINLNSDELSRDRKKRRINRIFEILNNECNL